MEAEKLRLEDEFREHQMEIEADRRRLATERAKKEVDMHAAQQASDGMLGAALAEAARAKKEKADLEEMNQKLRGEVAQQHDESRKKELAAEAERQHEKMVRERMEMKHQKELGKTEDHVGRRVKVSPSN